MHVHIKLTLVRDQRGLGHVHILNPFIWKKKVRVMVYGVNTIFNNNSVKSWRSVLLMEKTEVLRENHRPAASHWQTLSHDVVSSTQKNGKEKKRECWNNLYWASMLLHSFSLCHGGRRSRWLKKTTVLWKFTDKPYGIGSYQGTPFHQQ